MPKVVDHRVRRTELADAVMRLAAREGLSLISLRYVAAEAGVSMGLVQHYFGTKDEMFSFAIQVVRERVEQRLADRSAQLGAEPQPRQAAEALLRELLPLDDRRWLEGHVGLAYAAYSAVRPDLSAPLREQTRQLREFLTVQIRATRGERDGMLPSADVAATTLVSLVEGLSMHVLTGHLSASEAVAAFEAQLAVAFGAAPEAVPAKKGQR
ncbi:MAG: TetR family transcriptional regulator [Streptosporangiales bacterium]|nr:TetR family transcriptional regulator [Streptosporangiales bacterium]